ncbi:MAG: SufD family Fe-S cluster assembly protein [Bacteroidales bacterium]|nr:SufD family Fe-S cluster assembly protein [Bacteroidales bacterium]
MDRIYRVGIDEVPKRLTLNEIEHLRLTFIVMAGVSADIPFEINIGREGVNLEIFGLYLCPHSERVRFNITVRHLAGGSHSSQLFRGIVGGTAKAEFDGLVYVAKNAQKTEAFQENHSLLLDKGACAETHPQLEIYADDVKCSHGATTGYLNPDELFYMRSRGIAEAEARKLQMISFVNPVISHLPEEMQRQIISRL